VDPDIFQTSSKTVVCVCVCKCFEIKIGMHHGSALSLLLPVCVIVIEATSREFRVALPWEFLYADDFVVIAETEDDLIKRLNEWKGKMENRGIDSKYEQESCAITKMTVRCADKSKQIATSPKIM